MGGSNSMPSGPVSQIGSGNQVNQMNPNQSQISMGPSQPQSMNMPTHSTQGAPMVSQMGVPSQNVMGNRARPPMNIGNQQQPTDPMQMRQMVGLKCLYYFMIKIIIYILSAFELLPLGTETRKNIYLIM